MKLTALVLIVLASVTATELHMSYSLDRLEQTQNKADVEFQQIRADW